MLHLPAPPETAVKEEDIRYNEPYWGYTLGFVLSFIGILFIMVSFFSLKRYKEPLCQIIFYISLCDLIINITMGTLYLLDTKQLSDLKCNIFIWIAHYAALVSFSWVTCFAHAFYHSVKDLNTRSIQEKMKYYLYISFVIPVILAQLSIYWGFADYDEDKNYCFHKIEYGKLDPSFFYTENLPFFTALIISLVYYIESIRLMRRSGQTEYTWKTLQFPMVLFLCWIGQQFNVFSAQMGFHFAWRKALGEISQTLIYSQGFMNAFVYGCSYQVFSGCKDLFKRSCRKRNEESMRELSNTGSEGFSESAGIRDALLERLKKINLSIIGNSSSAISQNNNSSFHAVYFA